MGLSHSVSSTETFSRKEVLTVDSETCVEMCGHRGRNVEEWEEQGRGFMW